MNERTYEFVLSGGWVGAFVSPVTLTFVMASNPDWWGLFLCGVPVGLIVLAIPPLLGLLFGMILAWVKEPEDW